LEKIDIGLRSNKQEVVNFALSQIDPNTFSSALPNFDNVDK